MSENEAAITNGAAEGVAPEAGTEEITYHAVEKDGVVTAIWEMQGRKHLRTIDPRSRQETRHSSPLHHRTSRESGRSSSVVAGLLSATDSQPTASFTQPNCAVRPVQTPPNYLLIDRRASAWPGD